MSLKKIYAASGLTAWATEDGRLHLDVTGGSVVMPIAQFATLIKRVVQADHEGRFKKPPHRKKRRK